MVASTSVLQLTGTSAQFSLGKSFPGFSPTGPVAVTPDELPDRDDIGFASWLDGQPLQQGRTSEMIFPVDLVARLSAVCPLLPSDLIFTGTAGVGNRMQPPRYLDPGQTLVSHVHGVGRSGSILWMGDRRDDHPRTRQLHVLGQAPALEVDSLTLSALGASTSLHARAAAAGYPRPGRPGHHRLAPHHQRGPGQLRADRPARFPGPFRPTRRGGHGHRADPGCHRPHRRRRADRRAGHHHPVTLQNPSHAV